MHCSAFASRIERTKRHVSAFEIFVIPRLESTARRISLALEEREASSFYRTKIVGD
ncbi:MAG: V-type ATP synthase subunit D [Promethearchaeati archaeon]